MILPFGKPIVSGSEYKSVIKVLKSGKYVHGIKTIEFEHVIALTLYKNS